MLCLFRANAHGGGVLGIIDDDMDLIEIMASLRRYGVGSGQYTILLGALVFDHEKCDGE